MGGTTQNSKPKPSGTQRKSMSTPVATDSNYRWLPTNHHCGDWTCAKNTSHPAAIQRCLALHSEVCPLYHETMFMRGRSNECRACGMRDGQRYTRHREIAILLSCLRDGDVDGPGMPMKRRPSAIVTAAEVEKVAATMQHAFYVPDAAALDAPDDLVEEGMKVRQGKKFKQSPADVELFGPLEKSTGNGNVRDMEKMRRCARICAAFGLRLGGGRGSHDKKGLDEIEKIFEAMRAAVCVNENETNGMEQRKAGFELAAGRKGRESAEKL